MFFLKSFLQQAEIKSYILHDNQVSFDTSHGSWSFQLFGEKVIKTTFQPIGYLNNEQVSDAVIQQPSSCKIKVKTAGDAVISFGKIPKVLIGDAGISYQFGKETVDVR